jgi:Bacteriophage clamp loader A subunit
MPDLGDFLNSINLNKKNLMDDPETLEEVEKAYLPFIVNRLLSMHPDALFAANEMNQRPSLDKRMQYEYLLYILRSRKRFGKFQKPEEIENLNVVKEYFGYSNAKAKDALKYLDTDEIEYMKARLYKGGAKGR